MVSLVVWYLALGDEVTGIVAKTVRAYTGGGQGVGSGSDGLQVSPLLPLGTGQPWDEQALRVSKDSRSQNVRSTRSPKVTQDGLETSVSPRS